MTTKTFSLLLFNPKQPNETHTMLITKGDKSPKTFGMSTTTPMLMVHIKVETLPLKLPRIVSFAGRTQGMDKALARELVQMENFVLSVLGVSLTRGPFPRIDDVKASAQHPVMQDFLHHVLGHYAALEAGLRV